MTLLFAYLKNLIAPVFGIPFHSNGLVKALVMVLPQEVNFLSFLFFISPTNCITMQG